MKKVSYRGLAKNTARLYTLFGLANLLIGKSPGALQRPKCVLKRQNEGICCEMV